MSKQLVTFIMILALIGCTGTNNCKKRSPDNDNGISPESKLFDFGQVSNSKIDSVSFSFTLNNKGDKDVIINDIDATCPCIVLSNKPKIIQHNKCAIIRGRIGIKGGYGKQNKAVFVNYNDNNILLLRIVGEITNEAKN